MITIQHNEQTVSCNISKENVHITDSYLIRKASDMREIIKLIKAEADKQGFNYKRSNFSWLIEWKAHNHLYDKEIEQDRTASVDLNENESIFKRIGYFLLALRYRA